MRIMADSWVGLKVGSGGGIIGYLYPISNHDTPCYCGCQYPISRREKNFMFSQTVEYALRAVVHLADHAPDARTTDQIATATLVPKAYLSKVIQGLCRANVV